MKIIPVILAGGTGSRLWPLSREQYPKQFLALSDANLSMIQRTILNLKGLGVEKPIVICNEDHRFLVAEQLRQLNMEADILLEPCARNTAPAIGLAALHAVEQCSEEAVLLVLPADHLIEEVQVLHERVKHAFPLAEEGYLITFGVVPSKAETGYGYIKIGDDLGGDGAYTIARFVEKPDLNTANKLIAAGDYLWNSGMFLFGASRYLEELGCYSPSVLESCRDAYHEKDYDGNFIRVGLNGFQSSPDESVDYAVMEKTLRGAVLKFNSGWSDIGSWSALWEAGEKDKNGNVIKGDVYNSGGAGNLIFSNNRLVVTLGVNDLIVVETKDAVLVARKSASQEVKEITAHLRENNRTEHVNHNLVYRPWGMYESIEKGIRYQVKRITVRPGASLSVQMHHHRAEHWIVVSGTAKVLNGDKEYLVTENQSTYIPIGQVHSLENPGLIPLELIEVQSGEYLGEDDIVRLRDKYGRVKFADEQINN